MYGVPMGNCGLLHATHTVPFVNISQVNYTVWSEYYLRTSQTQKAEDGCELDKGSQLLLCWRPFFRYLPSQESEGRNQKLEEYKQH
jgi:hypothetical protein